MIPLLALLALLIVIYLTAGALILYHLYKYRLPPTPLLLAHQSSDKTSLIAGIFILVSLAIIGAVLWLAISTPWGDIAATLQSLKR